MFYEHLSAWYWSAVTHHNQAVIEQQWLKRCVRDSVCNVTTQHKIRDLMLTLHIVSVKLLHAYFLKNEIIIKSTNWLFILYSVITVCQVLQEENCKPLYDETQKLEYAWK